MDIKLEKKPWYIRYRYYLAGVFSFAIFFITIYIVTVRIRSMCDYWSR